MSEKSTRLILKAANNFSQLNWRAIHSYASQRARARYQGSILGEFWHVSTTSIFLVSVAIVWSKIWQINLSEYFAYFATGFIFYTFFAGSMNESAGLITADRRLYLNAYVSPLFSIFAHIYRNIITFFHHCLILAIIFFLFHDSDIQKVFITLSWFTISILFLIPSCYFLGMISVRYRDLNHFIHSLFQIMFLVTPVMWRIDKIPDHLRGFIFINPVASLLNLTRDNLLGMNIYPEAILSIFCWTFISWALYFALSDRLERNFTLWL